MENEIKQALEKNVDLSKEEYADLSKKADQSTETHGIEGKAPISETLRHKRIQSNYYGIDLNIKTQELAALANIETLLQMIVKKMYAIDSKGVEDVGRKQD